MLTLCAQEHLYVVHYESAAGVVSETTMDQLPQLLAAGTIKQNTRVWMDGMEGWTELVRRSYNLLQLLLVLIMLDLAELRRARRARFRRHRPAGAWLVDSGAEAGALGQHLAVVGRRLCAVPKRGGATGASAREACAKSCRRVIGLLTGIGLSAAVPGVDGCDAAGRVRLQIA